MYPIYNICIYRSIRFIYKVPYTMQYNIMYLNRINIAYLAYKPYALSQNFKILTYGL